jgi:hypothetical protein
MQVTTTATTRLRPLAALAAVSRRVSHGLGYGQDGISAQRFAVEHDTWRNPVPAEDERKLNLVIAVAIALAACGRATLGTLGRDSGTARPDGESAGDVSADGRPFEEDAGTRPEVRVPEICCRPVAPGGDAGDLSPRVAHGEGKPHWLMPHPSTTLVLAWVEYSLVVMPLVRHVHLAEAVRSQDTT